VFFRRLGCLCFIDNDDFLLFFKLITQFYYWFIVSFGYNCILHLVCFVSCSSAYSLYSVHKWFIGNAIYSYDRACCKFSSSHMYVAYVVSCFVLRCPFRQNQLTTYVYSAIGGSLYCDAYIKSAFRAQNTSKHTLILYTCHYWWSMRSQKPVTK